jgi:uracil-DNA glycosylase
MQLLDRVRVIVTLGQVAFDQVWNILAKSDVTPARKVRFAHLAEVPLRDGRTLLGSYHPSQQNTFTGKLTEPMFDRVWARARELAGGRAHVR